MHDLYTTGQYLDKNSTWGAEDSPWKADHVFKIIKNNDIYPKTIAEIGCGAGIILSELKRKKFLKDVQFKGYDISPQAIEICKKNEGEGISYFCQDLIGDDDFENYDILLIIDVFEHVPDYMGFIEKCRYKAEYKIYHIPLDIHVSSVLRNQFIRGRDSVGHLHYFTADSALATLKDTGHEIIDYVYTEGAIACNKYHPKIRTLIANAPRWFLSKFSVQLTARILGGYSLLVLTR